jgi:hypothetical protein
MMRGKGEAATVAASATDSVRRIEIVADRRRRHEASFRAEFVAESMMTGARVRDVAQRHRVCQSLAYRSRRVAGPMPPVPAEGFLPVRITEAPASDLPTGAAVLRRPGGTEIELSVGKRVRLGLSPNSR